jgi:chorismate mutase
MASPPDQELEELRREVDRLDRSLVELLAERLRVVREIARIKRTAAAGEPAIRPGREAVILRRLVAQADGRFPAVTLIRMWRELLAATTRVQAPLAVVACVPPNQPEIWDLARDHFGATVPLQRMTAWRHALGLLANGVADLAVLPLPAPDAPWWGHLVDAADRPLRVVSRLPFGPASPQLKDRAAMVVGTIAPEPSGADLSLVAIATPSEVPGVGLVGALAAAGLASRVLAALPGNEVGTSLHLLELDGFLTTADAPLADALEQAGPLVLRSMWLGGYARPLAAVE